MTSEVTPGFPEIVRFTSGCPLCALSASSPGLLTEVHRRHAQGASGGDLVSYLGESNILVTRGTLRAHLVSHIQTGAIGLGDDGPVADPSGKDIQAALDAGVPAPTRPGRRRARLSLVRTDNGSAGPGAVPATASLGGAPGASVSSSVPRPPDPHLETGIQEGYFDLYDQLRDALIRVQTSNLFEGELLSSQQVGAWTSIAREFRSTLDSIVKHQQSKQTLDAAVQSHTRRFVIALAQQVQLVLRPMVQRAMEDRVSSQELGRELEHFARDTLAELVRSAADDALRETREVFRISEAV